MDPGEESFSLSTFNFNSSFALYSSDDDVDTYIELELRSAASAAHQVAGSDGGDDELRISFSAVVPFPGFFPSKPSFDQPTPAVDSTQEEVMESKPLPINRRLIGTIRFPPSVDNDYPHINGWELVRTRQASVPGVKGGITKLLVKLRSIIISGFGSMRAQPANPNGRMKPFERWLALCKPTERAIGSSRSSTTLKVTEMKFETMRKLFGNAVTQIKNKSNRRMSKTSCPTSAKSSPVHQLGGDASLVHAAIAHCKKSFGQNDDFSF